MLAGIGEELTGWIYLEGQILAKNIRRTHVTSMFHVSILCANVASLFGVAPGQFLCLYLLCLIHSILFVPWKSRILFFFQPTSQKTYYLYCSHGLIFCNPCNFNLGKFGDGGRRAKMAPVQQVASYANIICYANIHKLPFLQSSRQLNGEVGWAKRECLGQQDWLGNSES